MELSTFVGRSHEVKSLAEELDGHRLVTLIGVGGTGKTRLAIETGCDRVGRRSPMVAGSWSWRWSPWRRRCRSRSLPGWA